MYRNRQHARGLKSRAQKLARRMRQSYRPWPRLLTSTDNHARYALPQCPPPFNSVNCGNRMRQPCIETSGGGMQDLHASLLSEKSMISHPHAAQVTRMRNKANWSTFSKSTGYMTACSYAKCQQSHHNARYNFNCQATYCNSSESAS
jgi:hypothetical protein